MANPDFLQPWFHGSPLHLTRLLAGSTITQNRRLAEVFSHKPTLVCIADDGQIQHNGTQSGWLYRIANPFCAEDVIAHPNSSMEAGLEWLTTRELDLELLGPAKFMPGEILTKDDIAALHLRSRR